MNRLHAFTFLNNHQATLAQAHLRHNGLKATLDGDQLSTALSYMGPAVTKSRLLVQLDDAEAAQALINEFMATLSDSPETSQWGESTQWLCDFCDEGNAFSFDVCWCCGTDRPESPRHGTAVDEIPGEALEEINETLPEPDSDSPYRTPRVKTTWKKLNASLLDRFNSKYVRLAILTLAMPPFGVIYLLCRVFERSRDNGTPQA